MNEEQSRRNLEAKLSESGYVHPTTVNTVSSNTYMSYYESDPSKCYESNSNNSDIYATFNADGDPQSPPKAVVPPANDYRKCPVCRLSAAYMCSCELKDRMCKNSHVWYVKNNTLYQGDPHENEDE